MHLYMYVGRPQQCEPEPDSKWNIVNQTVAALCEPLPFTRATHGIKHQLHKEEMHLFPDLYLLLVK